MPRDLAALVARAPDSRHGSGASAEQIARAARALGVRWPRSYGVFLRELGWFDSPLLTIHGLGPRVERTNHVVRETKSEYTAWADIHPLPPGLVVISPDGRGGFHALDTARMKHAECPVVYWDHELAGYPEYTPEHAGKSFETFFRRNLPRGGRERQIKGPITIDTALTRLKREVKRAGIVGNDLWKAPDSPRSISAAERRLGLTFPADLRRVLSEVGGFEHAGGWYHFGVSARLPETSSMLVQAARLRAKSARNRTLVPLARTSMDQLCCLDLALDPPGVVALDFETLRRDKELGPLPLAEWIVRICKPLLDPWRP